MIKISPEVKNALKSSAISSASRISSRRRPKFFEQHSPVAVVKPSKSSRNRDIEASSRQERMDL